MLIDKARQKLRNVAKQLCMGQRRGRPFSVLTLHKFVYKQKVKLHTFLPSHWDNKIILKTWAMILFRVATIFFLANFFFISTIKKSSSDDLSIIFRSFGPEVLPGFFALILRFSLLLLCSFVIFFSHFLGCYL